MSTKNGKLLVLGGFGLILAKNALQFILTLSRSVLEVGGIVGIMNMMICLGWVAVAAGFCLIFLCERSLLNLLVAGAFALQALFMLTMMMIQSGKPVDYNVYQLVMRLSIFIGFINLFAFVLWCRAVTRRNPMIGLMLNFSIIADFCYLMFSSKIAASGTFLSAILTLGIATVHAYVAYAEYISD